MDNKYTKEYLTSPHSPKEWHDIFNSDSFDSAYCYSEKDLGFTYSPSSTIIKVWAPTAKSIAVALYLDGFNSHPDKSVNLVPSQKFQGIWEVELKGDYQGYYYTFTTNANGKQIVSGDPYARACGVNGIRSMIVDMNKTNPDNWAQDTHVFHHANETFIYELHIGDFSNDPNSGVSKDHQGKYLAFTESETVFNSDPTKPTCMNYLKKLGITSIHLMPCFDYGSVDESIVNNDQFNWGYDPLNYNVPEGSYSTNPFKGEIRIKEFKQMVQSIHNAGMSVIMDVVYNHTYSPESHFNGVVPFYYYRQEDDGKYCDGSGCGNDTASERKMVHNYIVESVLYWFNEYHVDGFRFDLMGLHDTQLMNSIISSLEKEENGSKALIYGEPWSCDNTNMKKGFISANKKNINELHKQIAMFNDDLRDSIKGKYCNEEPGFINGGQSFDKLVERYFSGKISLEYPQPRTPSRLISYISCHDNNTLWDKLVDSILMTKEYLKPNKTLIEMNKLGASISLLSHGIPFFMAGEEAARTKLGEINSYNLAKTLNQLDWGRMYEYEHLIEYYRELISLRKKLHSFYKLNNVNIQWLNGLPSGVIACQTKISKNADFNELFIVFNSSQANTTIPIKGKWKVLLNSSNLVNTENDLIEDKVISEPISTIVIAK